MDKLLPSFKIWLREHHYHPNTIRNYLSDVNKFLLSGKVLETYFFDLKSSPNYRRELSSLNKFFQYKLDQNLILQNPLKNLLKPNRLRPTIHDPRSILEQFEDYLTHQKKTPITIKNYINDIRQYLEFVNSNEPI